MPNVLLSPIHLTNFWSLGDDTGFVRCLLGTGPRTPPSNPPRPPLLRGQFRIELESNQEIDVESMSDRYQIDPRGGEGEADLRVGSGGSVPNKPLTTLDPAETPFAKTPFSWCPIWGAPTFSPPPCNFAGDSLRKIGKKREREREPPVQQKKPRQK